MKDFTVSAPLRTALPVLAFLFVPALPIPAQLLTNLHSFPDRISVGDPQVHSIDNKEGPKGITSADFNGDGKPDIAAGNLDGTITVLHSLGGGRFAVPRHLRTGALELRSVLAADLNGDGLPDLAAASPMDGKLLLFFNPGGGNFGVATPLPGWFGVRSLAAGDFDGDGITDLVAAGPGHGVRHFRGTGGGSYEIMGDLPQLSPFHAEIPRPVYTMHTIRSHDGLHDELLVTHADSPALWILSTVPVDRRSEPAMELSKLPGWRVLPSPVLLHEVQVQNANTLRDSDGTAQPWVELINKSPAAVNLSGWSLRSESSAWTFPSVTVDPGRMLTVFLSGKNRNAGPELHASFLLRQNSADLSLHTPAGVEAHRLALTDHTMAGISMGLAPDLNAVRYFDIPSPGAENNAGFNSPDDFRQQTQATLTITPRHPSPGDAVTIRVALPEHPTGSSSVQNVWFSAVPSLTEVHFPLRRLSSGVFETVLPPGTLTGSTPHRVLTRLRDGTGNDYTTEAHRGLDEAESSALVTPRNGCLLPVASVPSPKVKAFQAGALTVRFDQPGVMPDLVLADDAGGLLRVHRSGPGARRFEPLASQELQVRGAPRDVKLADNDDDGWLDATVVLRSLDLAVTFHNDDGTLRSTGELPTGRSPREAVIADFTGDGSPDAAVINRYSADISILPGSNTRPGLVSLDQIYPVSGEVAGLLVKDLNGDGRDDVMQLHRASGELSTRYAGPDGTLGVPVFRSTAGATGTTSQSPSALTTADVNNDGRPDLLTANLGFAGSGSISVLLAKPDGTFDPPRTFATGGGMFAISAADFDKDGNQDVVAGLFDCRVVFFRGDGSGNFTSSYFVFFAYESRVMVTGDFDQDGDIDIAGAGYAGDMVTLENRGAANAVGWFKQSYAASDTRSHGTERIGITFINADSDPDLIIGTGQGVVVYTGGPAMEFHAAPELGGGTGFSVSDVFTRDLDGDGSLEMVTACRNASCINILTQNASGEFILVTQADVPSGRYLASGDLDGDGKPDLVGTGDVLWTVLSGRPPQTADPGINETTRTQSSGVVINEVLGQNTGVALTADNGRKTDFVEIFNGATTPATVTGWKLRLQSIQDGAAVDQTWTLPAVTAGAKGHALVIFSEETGGMHTGFTLPAEGGTLTLLRPDNSEADRVTYPPAQENVSWSRYLDGHPSFRADGIPSPGMSNVDNGTVPPEVKLTPPAPATLVPGQPLKFTAKGRDDSGIISLSLLWNRLDAPFAEPQRVILYDDGMHADAGAVDGLFAGTLTPALPAGAEVQFYLEAVDLSGEVLLLPENAELTGPGESPAAWSFSLTIPPPLEITAVVTNNTTLLRDEQGSHPDYVTVRNTGAVPVDMSPVLLARSPLAAGGAAYAYPSGLVLPPGSEITVYADGDPSQGPLHAPFTLDAGGDDVSLLTVRQSGARQWIQSLPVTEMSADAQFRLLPGTGLHAALPAGATLTNWSGISHDAGGTALATVHFTALPGIRYSIEGDPTGDPTAWIGLTTLFGDGAVHTITRPLAEMSALRVVGSATGPFPLRVDAVVAADTGAGIFGEAAPAAGTVKLFFGTASGGSNPAAWSRSVTSEGAKFGFQLDGLLPDTTYHYNIRATHTADTNAIESWLSGGSTMFRTLPAGLPHPASLTLTSLNPASARVEIAFDTPPPPGAAVTVIAGPADKFATVAAWPLRIPAVRDGTGQWSAALAGLQRQTSYFARAVLETPGGAIVSPQRLEFRTPGKRENLVWNLRLSEIMYHPAALNPAETAAGFEQDDFEYIELHNASDDSMDLNGLWFDGIDFDFPPVGSPVLPSGGYAVIATNPHAFAMRYGNAVPIAGWTLHPFRRSRLANGGEVITLSAADGTVLFSVAYDDDSSITDGGGYSLEFHSPPGSVAPEDSEHYFAGLYYGGTPGYAADVPPALTYDAWKASKFSAAQVNSPVSGMDHDADHDGLSNFAEYACGTHPLVPNSPDVLAADGQSLVNGGFLTFPASLEALHAVIVLESTSDANRWNAEAAFSFDDHYPFYHQPYAANWKQVQIRVPLPSGGNIDGVLRKFYRLNFISR